MTQPGHSEIACSAPYLQCTLLSNKQAARLEAAPAHARHQQPAQQHAHQQLTNAIY